MPNRENIVQLRLQHNFISLTRSDGLPRGLEEGSAEMVFLGDGKAGLVYQGEENAGVGLQLRLDLRLHLAPAVAKLASQAGPASPAARPAPPRGRAPPTGWINVWSPTTTTTTHRPPPSSFP